MQVVFEHKLPNEYDLKNEIKQFLEGICEARIHSQFYYRGYYAPREELFNKYWICEKTTVEEYREIYYCEELLRKDILLKRVVFVNGTQILKLVALDLEFQKTIQKVLQNCSFVPFTDEFSILVQRMKFRYGNVRITWDDTAFPEATSINLQTHTTFEISSNVQLSEPCTKRSKISEYIFRFKPDLFCENEKMEADQYEEPFTQNHSWLNSNLSQRSPFIGMNEEDLEHFYSNYLQSFH